MHTLLHPGTRLRTCALATLLSAAGLVAGAPAPQQPGLPDAAELLDRLAERDAEIATKKSMITRGTCRFVVRGMGDQGRDGEFEEYFQGKQVHATYDFGMFVMTEGSDGEVSWTIDPMTGATVLEGNQKKQMERRWGLARGESWRDHFSSAKTVAAVQIGGLPCYRIELQPSAGGDVETWYLDKESLDLAGIDMRMVTPNGEEDIEVRFGDWREISGQRQPGQWHVKVQHADIHYEVEEIVFDEKIPASRFALPDAIVDALADAELIGEDEEPEPAAEDEPKDEDELEVEIDTIARRAVASIRANVAEEKIGETLAIIIPEVMNHMMENGHMPMGPPFTRYFDTAGKTIRFEAGFPLPPNSNLEETDRIKVGALPGGKVAVCWHYGHYEKIGDTMTRFRAWAKNKDMKMSDVQWEVYWTDPGREPDPSKWRTQLFWMLANAKDRQK